MRIDYAAKSDIGSGYASRTLVNGKPIESVAMATGIHLISQSVFESVMTVHGIPKEIEGESGDKFVAWRAEFTGVAAETLSRIGAELLAAFKMRQVADASVRDARRIAIDTRESSAELSMIGMDA